MKPAAKYVLLFLMIAVAVVVFYLAFGFIRKNEISQKNGLKRKAKKEYLTHQYIQASETYAHLIDSLGVQDDAARINYGNALFLSTNIHEKKANQKDTLRRQLTDASLQQYAQLFSSPDAVIASMAANQSGYVTIKSANSFQKLTS